MKATVKKLTTEKAIIDFNTSIGNKTLEVDRTPYGKTYKDFSDWDISDEEYYEIEEIVDRICDEMDLKNVVVYDLE